MINYTTIQGDMWDTIALKFFGEEKYIDVLIAANFKHREEAVFSAGIVLDIPEIETNNSSKFAKPVWRENTR